MDLLLDAVCIVDAEGRYVYVNAAFERIFGYRPDEIIGQRMIDLVYAEDRDKTLRSAASVMAGRPNFHFENRYVHKRGHIVDVMWSARWSEEQQARIAVARDITARKQSEAVQQAMHAISEATHLATDLPELLQRLRDIVARLLPCDDFRIVLSDVSHGPPPRDQVE
ncbi:MAG TPA: PAS domain S-box protein, partial [Rhodocyclaceae bacterium]|nr:PAS domain S-box protein [Rhodocyclaceae bacterium]